MIDGHALGEQDHRALGSRVRSPEARPIDAQHRGHVDDRTAPGFPQVRQYRPRELPESANVGVEGFIPLLLRDLFNVSRVKYSSVVYQDIDSAERIHRPFDQSFNVSPLRHIRGHGYGPCACFAGYLLDPVLAAAHQNDAGARGSKLRHTRPMPLPAPVTIATLFSRREFIGGTEEYLILPARCFKEHVLFQLRLGVVE